RDPGQIRKQLAQSWTQQTRSRQWQQKRHHWMKQQDHADFRKPEWTEMAQSELSVSIEAVPDHFGNPGFVKAEQYAPEIHSAEGGSSGAHRQRGEEEKMREVQPVSHQQGPGRPESGDHGCSGKTLGGYQDEKSEQEPWPGDHELRTQREAERFQEIAAR